MLPQSLVLLRTKTTCSAKTTAGVVEQSTTLMPVRKVKMRTISIDIETYSSVDLTKAGVYRYAESPDFEILLFDIETL